MPSTGRSVQPAPRAFAPSSVALGLAEWAARDPGRQAMSDQQETMSFAQLNALVAAWAEHIVDAASDAGAWMPVVVERSVHGAAALHAVVRAARPFTAIECTSPRARVEEYFARLGHPRVAVVCRPEHAELLPNGVTAIPAPICLDSGIAPQPFDPHTPGSVVFTSGSTGRPKGVVRHWSAFDAGLARQEVESRRRGLDEWR